MASKRLVLIDTDGGVDDALALLLALRSPELEVVAITTVAGNVDVDKAVRNALLLVDIAGSVSRPPVAVGAEGPLEGEPVRAEYVHGSDGLGGLWNLKSPDGSPKYHPPSKGPSEEGAVEAILKACRKYGVDLTIIALGPLTNLALALEKDPEALRGVRKVVVLGGAISVHGNITPVSEFNIYSDPKAARAVFEAGLPLVLLPLDVVYKVVLPRRRLEEHAREHPSKLTQFLLDCTRKYFEFHREWEGVDGCYLADPLAVGFVLDEGLFKVEPMRVEVETEGRLTCGMTVADRRPPRYREGESPNALVCTDVDAEGFLSLFLERLG